MSPVVSVTLSVAALVLALLAIVLATIANRRWVRRAQVAPIADPALSRAQGVLRSQVDDLTARVDDLRAAVTDLTDRVEDQPVHDPTALRHVAVVRYDAFADVGGRLSYSVALLDDTRCGLVLTTLAGKADVRTYVRTISSGAGDATLTAEEQQAVDAAVGSRS